MNIFQKPIELIIKDNMMNYSAYVLLNRALPDIRDGLKPVHRRILYTMQLEKAFKLTKSANISGAVMKLHPHGDSYPTIVNMVQTDKQNIPLIVGKGNFAQHTSRDMAPGAARYTEIKLADVSKEMMNNLDKGLVKFVPNYDGTMKMPEVLPVKFPVILTQANSGIGVGFGSSIASFNVIELNESIIKYVTTGERTYLIPDFATGGFIDADMKAIKQINETGSGSVKLRGKAEIVDNEILITEIPYTTSREAIIEKIDEMAASGKIREVLSVKDLTGLKGQLIEVRCRKNSDMELVLKKLFKLTPLESTFSVNMNMLIDNLPRVVGTWEAIDYWLNWRRECIANGLRYDIDKMLKQLHLLEGLEKVLLDIDSAIEIIRHTPEAELLTTLQQHYSIDEVQANEVANMKLRHINRDYILKKVADIQALNKKLVTFNKILGSKDALNQIICKGLKESSEAYGKPRKTIVQRMEDVSKVVTKVVEKQTDYAVTIQLTKDGYIYKMKNKHEATLKAGDKIVQEFDTMHTAEVLVFTADGSCHKVKLSDIDDTKSGSFGTYLPAIIGDSNILNYSVLDNKYKFVVHVFENKKIAKIDLQSFVSNHKKLKNSISTKSKLINTFTFEKESKFKIYTERFDLECDTSTFTMSKSRSAQGANATTRKGEVTRAEKV